MPIIKSLSDNGPQVVLFVGRVVRIEMGTETRNCSDTLDFTDFQSVDVTYALVYIDETLVPLSSAEREYTKYARHEHGDKFVRVDCTNMFVWRGSPSMTPVVDEMECTVFASTWKKDLETRDALKLEAEVKAQELLEERRRLAIEEHARKLANVPVLGKQMRVARGRKVKVGTEGTVAFIRGDSVLLKEDAVWRDRKAQGVWVPASYLEAR